MTVTGWVQIVLFCRRRRWRSRGRSAAIMARVFDGERTFLSPVLGPVERGSTALAGVDERAGAALARPTPLAMLLFNLVGLLLLYVLQRLQGVLPLNPQGLAGGRAGPRVQHRRSFATNTNWQAYGGETTHELPHPDGRRSTVQNFVSAADRHGGRCRADPRLRARSADDDRQLLGRPDPRDALHPAAVCARPRAVPGLRRACCRPSAPTSTAHDARGRAQQTIARRPGRLAGSRSRSSAPTAAASSTPTPRTRSRTRRRSPTSSRCSSIFADRRRR